MRSDSQFCAGNIGILFLQTVWLSKTTLICPELGTVVSGWLQQQQASWSSATACSSIRTQSWMTAQIKPEHTQTATPCEIRVQMSTNWRNLSFTSADKIRAKLTRHIHMHVHWLNTHQNYSDSERKQDKLQDMFQKVTCLTYWMNLRAWSQISPLRHTLYSTLCVCQSDVLIGWDLELWLWLGMWIFDPATL